MVAATNPMKPKESQTPNSTVAPTEITMDGILEAINLIEKLPKIPVGIACSPAFKAQCQKTTPPAGSGVLAHMGGTPIIVDPRLKEDAGQVYYDEHLWRERCREQQAFDAARALEVKS